MDKFIPNFVQKKVNQDKHLYIFDQVGKQVRWLQYYLRSNDLNRTCSTLPLVPWQN